MQGIPWQGRRLRLTGGLEGVQHAAGGLGEVKHAAGGLGEVQHTAGRLGEVQHAAGDLGVDLQGVGSLNLHDAVAGQVQAGEVGVGRSISENCLALPGLTGKLLSLKLSAGRRLME